MIKKVQCKYCGKKSRVLIIFRFILSRKWLYFSNVKIMFHDGIRTEYWECKRCYKMDCTGDLPSKYFIFNSKNKYF